MIWEQRNYHWSLAGARLYTQHQFEAGALASLSLPPSPIEMLDRPDMDGLDLTGRLGVFPSEYATPWPATPEDLDRVLNGVLARNEGLGNYAPHMRPGQLAQARFYFGTRTTGRALLIGDSFSRLAETYFARHFAESLVIQTNDMRQPIAPAAFQAIADQYQPEIVVFLFEQAKFEPVNGSTRARDWISAFEPAAETNP